MSLGELWENLGSGRTSYQEKKEGSPAARGTKWANVPWAHVQEGIQVVPQKLLSGCFVVFLLRSLLFQCNFVWDWAVAFRPCAAQLDSAQNRARSRGHTSSMKLYQGTTLPCPHTPLSHGDLTVRIGEELSFPLWLNRDQLSSSSCFQPILWSGLGFSLEFRIFVFCHGIFLRN